MPKNKTPISELFQLFREKIILIIIIFAISIACSFYYNKNYKPLNFSYELKFDIISNWKTSQFDIDYKIVLGLTRSSILNLLKDFNPSDYNLNLEDDFKLSFIVNKKINVDNFIENLNDEMNNNIETILKQRLDILKIDNKIKEKQILQEIEILKSEKEELKNFRRLKISEENKKMKNELGQKMITLKIEKGLMKDQFSSFLDSELNSSNLYTSENSSQYDNNQFFTIIELKRSYVKISKDISEIEQKLKHGENLSSLYIFNEVDNLHKINKDIMTLEKQLGSRNLYSEIYLLEETIANFKKFKNRTFYNISDWIISNNEFSNKEIIAAGILFGLLFNSFVLFLTSNFLRKQIYN